MSGFAGLSPSGTSRCRWLDSTAGSTTIKLLGIFTLKCKLHIGYNVIALPTEFEGRGRSSSSSSSPKEIGPIGVKVEDLDAEYSLNQKEVVRRLGEPPLPLHGGRGGHRRLQRGQRDPSGTCWVARPQDPRSGANTLYRPRGLPWRRCQARGLQRVLQVHRLRQRRDRRRSKGPFAITHWKCRKGSQDTGIEVGKACQWQTGLSARPGTIDNDANRGGVLCWHFSVTSTCRRTPPWSSVRPVGPSPSATSADQGDLRRGLCGLRLEPLLVAIDGAEIFRLPLGDVYLAIHSDSGVEFGVGLGIGFPSYTNNENDPFYIGARVDGWVGKGKFQLEGKGRVALLGAKLFDGRILVMDRAAGGACWTVCRSTRRRDLPVRLDGREDVRDRLWARRLSRAVPRGCPCDRGAGRSVRLTADRHTLAVRGDGSAPRFTLRAADGRVIHTPTTGLSALAQDHAVVRARAPTPTHVILRNIQGHLDGHADGGRRSSTSLRGSIAPRWPPPASAAPGAPGRRLQPPTPEYVAAVHRADAQRPRDPDLRDRRRERQQRVHALARGVGKRRLRVVVVHGFGSRQSHVVDTYRVGHERRLRAPAKVGVARRAHGARALDRRKSGAQGYLVEVAMRQRGRLVTSSPARLGPDARDLHPASSRRPGRRRGEGVRTQRRGRAGEPHGQCVRRRVRW